MRMAKVNHEWRMILEAECPACGKQVERIKPRNKSFPASVKCPHCKYRVDRVYFN